MDLRKALSVLSKSSPYAVSTEGSTIDPYFDEVKKYLYISTDIEKAFKLALDNIAPDKIIFLCGSSGDGKSEILTRYSKTYADKAKFHLDATHSFKSKSTAIETLDRLFTDCVESQTPLVVGINIGMLGNFEREGAAEHQEIKSAIKSFLEDHVCTNARFIFLDFESFQKFKIKDGRISSDFFKTLLSRITCDDRGNKFRDLYNQAIASGKEKQLVANFTMLSDPMLQQVIVILLMRARIGKDQFITARMMLDFVYCILTEPGYLFDNMFNGGDNELLSALAEFDPSVIRNREIDLFVLERHLESDDENFITFRNEVLTKYHFDLKLVSPPQNLIRLFFLLQNSNIEHNFSKKFISSFKKISLDVYQSFWELHKNYPDQGASVVGVKDFYNKIALPAINKYANRHCPHLTRDEFFISSSMSCDLAAEIDFSVNYNAIEQDSSENLSFFNMYFCVNGEPLEAIPVSINLLNLMLDIVVGYRPNKHDKSSIVLMDELVDKITNAASLSKSLNIYSNKKLIKIKSSSNNEIRVSGL